MGAKLVRLLQHQLKQKSNVPNHVPMYYFAPEKVIHWHMFQHGTSAAHHSI